MRALARNVHEVRQTGAGADERSPHSQSANRSSMVSVRPTTKFRTNFNALCLQRVDFLLYDSLRETELRNAVHQNAAGGVQYLEYGDLVAHVAPDRPHRSDQQGRHRRQRPCGRWKPEPRSDRWTDVPLRSRQRKRSRRPMRNRLALDAADTLALALTLLRADTTADSREGAGLLDLVCLLQ